MKKHYICILCLVFSFVCFEKNHVFAQEVKSSMENSNKSLIVYFSLTNKTDSLAKIIKKESLADCYEISMLSLYLPFVKNITQPSAEKKEEMAKQSRLHNLDSIDAYETIYLGFPIWFNDMPFFMYKFLANYDFSDKEVRVFSTAGSSSIGSIVDNIKRALPRAKVQDALLINNETTKPSEELVKTWLDGLAYLK